MQTIDLSVYAEETQRQKSTVQTQGIFGVVYHGQRGA